MAKALVSGNMKLKMTSRKKKSDFPVFEVQGKVGHEKCFPCQKENNF